jgi:cytochrome c biogenesis protein CcmG/thiol:disulfide interchange protein DsbE
VQLGSTPGSGSGRRPPTWIGVETFKDLLPMALGLVMLAAPGRAAEKGSLKIGDTFPDFRQYSIEGTLPENTNGKVVIVDFWASWCGRCKESFELMEEMQARFGKKGLVIISVNVDESRAAMEEFLKEHPVSFIVVRDKAKLLVRAVNIPSMPTLFVLNPDGKVHSMYPRVHGPETRLKCVQDIKTLLKIPTSE